MQNANRNEWVDYAKGFGIVLVVYGHISRGLYNSGIISDTKWFHFIDSLIPFICRCSSSFLGFS
ncbi:acyltransferase [Klebsiella pneumoniae]|nr:acyltransferase [Klebsiella pneumoniae]SVP16364.1 acyltransferase [Klebsiella pneumoniae]